MKYTFEKQQDSTVKLKITLTASEWAEAQTVAYNKTKNRFNVPGFRKGHVPKHIIDKMYGDGVFYEEAINYSFSKYYFEILDKEPSIEAIDAPAIDVEKVSEKGATLIAIIPVKPEVKLGEYKGIKFDKIEYNVTDADIDGEIERLKVRNAREVSVTDRACQNGDVVVIDFKGMVDGVAFEGGTAEKYDLELGANRFIPGFEDQVVGMNIGEDRNINVKFPEDYHSEDLKGKDAVFAIKLHEIKVKEMPEVNDEFIKEATGEESLDAFKASTKAKLEEANAKKAKSGLEEKMVKTIVEKSEVVIPSALIDRQSENLVKDMEYRMMYQGLKLDDYLKYTNQTREDYKKSFNKQAEEQVKSQLVLGQIITDEKITASQEEIDAKIAEQATMMGKTFEDFKKSLNENQIDYFENNAVLDKLFAFLTENNVID